MHLVSVSFNSMVIASNLILMTVEILIYLGHVIKYTYRLISKHQPVSR